MARDLIVVEPTRFAEIQTSNEGQVDVHLRLEVPIYECTRADLPDSIREKAEHDDDDDVYIRGPVYVGSVEMLDRHRELVAPEAIIDSWATYKTNPVILLNHRKDYGTIGRMLEVELGAWDGIDFPVPIGYAQIDGGETGIVRKIRKGFLRAFSIGFIAKAGIKECPDGEDDESCYITFTEIDWVETSVVDIPASPGALFNVEKMVITKGWRADESGEGMDITSDNGFRKADQAAEKHIIGYQDMGDRIAILFEKETPADAEADEEVGDEGERSLPKQEITELSVGSCSICEQSSDSGCSCSTKQTDDKSTVLNSPISKSNGLAKGGDTMTEQELIEATSDELTDEPVVEPVVESPVIEEKETLPKPVEVLVQVVKELQSINERLDTQQKAHDEEVAELQAKIATLQTDANEATEQATFEAEVSKRVAELVGEQVVAEPEAVAAPEAERKSETHSPLDAEVAKSTIGVDPYMKQTDGQKGLKGWLEYQIAARGTQ